MPIHKWGRESFVVPFLVAIVLYAVPLQGQGGVILMGVDAEDGGPGGHGPITVYENVVTFLKTNCVRNGGTGILVVGGGKMASDDVTRFWNQIQTDTAMPVTFVNGAANITSQSFSGFAVIAVISSGDPVNTPDGGLTQAEHDALAARQGDVAAFINGGGGLIGFTSNFTTPYGYLAGVGAFTVTTGGSYMNITPTPAGVSTGITDALDICCWHDTYTTFPPFLQVLANDAGTGQPAAIGGCQISVPPANPCLEVEVKKERILCTTDGSGNFSYSFEFTNLSTSDVHHLFLLDPAPSGVTLTPDYKNFSSSPIAPGAASGPIPVTIKGAQPGDQVTFLLSAHDENLEACCTQEHTVTLPPCDCAQITADSAACSFFAFPFGQSGFTYSFTLQNLSSINVQNVLLAPIPPPLVTFTPNRIKTSLPTPGSTTPQMLPITVRGATSGQVCFLISLHDASLDECCSIRQCVDPDFCFLQPYNPTGGAVVLFSEDEVRVSNPDPEHPGGVTVGLQGTLGVDLAWRDLDPAGAVAAGAALELAVADRGGESGVRQIGSLRAAKTGPRIAVSADFDGLGATRHRAEVYLGDRLVGAASGLGTAIAEIPDWPTGGGVEKESRGVGLDFRSAPGGVSWRLADGSTLLGDRLRVLPDNPATPVGDLAALELRPTGLPSLRLESELALRDCNANGRPDITDLAAGTSADANGDGVPDECGARAPAPTCSPSATRLCLNRGRFAVEIDWQDFGGASGPGRAVPLTEDTGTFWFFAPANLELVVKVLDGRAVNDRWWVFYGALTNVGYTLRVTDTVTGAVRSYTNPPGRLASAADTNAFPSGPATAGSAAHVVPAALPITLPPGQGTCIPSPASLCLQGSRFRVEVAWEGAGHLHGTGQVLPLTSDTGAFWFFDRANVELIVKVLDGRAANGRWWVFFGALSDVEYTVSVTDTLTNQKKTYRNPQGRLASVGDTAAF